MLIALSLLGLSVASVGLLAFELWNAPEAYEDVSGFHRVGHTDPPAKTRKSNPRVSSPDIYETGINEEQPVLKSDKTTRRFIWSA